MAQEVGYQQQVEPQAAAPLPLATPENFGAGAAQAAGELGQTIEHGQLQAYARQRQITADRETTDVAHKFALHRQAMDGITDALKSDPTDPGYVDHLNRVKDANEAGLATILDGVTEDSVRRETQRQFDAYSTALYGQESGFVEAQRVAKTVTDTGAAADTSANRLTNNPTVPAWRQELAAGYATVANLHAPEETKDKLARLFENKTTAGYFDGLNSTNPELSLQQLGSGQFNSYLTDEQFKTLKSGAEVEIRRRAAQAEHLANVGKAALADQLSEATKKNAAGIDVSADLPALRAAAVKFNDQSSIAAIDIMDRDSQFAKVWNPMPPMARQQRETTLEAIDPAKRSEAQQQEIKWLKDHQGPLDTKFIGEPVDFVIQNGKPAEQPPPLIPGQQASYDARAAWSRSLAPAYGGMGLLSGAEKKTMQAQMHTGDAGYFEVANELARFGNDASRAAQEVEPNDAVFQHLAALGPNTRQFARDGQQVLKTNPKILHLDPGPQQDIDAQTQAMQRAMPFLNGDQLNAIQNVARNISAQALNQHAPGTELDTNLWRQALSLALGARKGPNGQQLGGLSVWGDSDFVAPETMTGQQFQNEVMAAVGKDPKHGPLNPDGSPANIRIARPVVRADGTYQWWIGNRAVLTRGPSGKIDVPWTYTVKDARPVSAPK